MDFFDYDLSLGDEQREIQKAARTFAAEVLRPAGIALDRLSGCEVSAPGSPLFDVLRQASELGYTRLLGPEALGGLGLSPLTAALVLEELAWGNLGLAAVFFLAGTPAQVALLSGNSEAIEAIAVPYFRSSDGSLRGCWAITEPDHGSDTLGVMRPELVVKAPGQVVARREGDGWVIRGQKSAWVSNGPIATHAMLNVHLEPAAGLDRGGVCLLSLDLPGVTHGPALEKHGARSLPQGELFFDDVHVPRWAMVVEPDAYPAYMENHLASFNAGVGVVATGLARAAFDAALAYTRERVQGGRPIAEHQSVRARLFRMFQLVQACRTLARGVWTSNLTLLETSGRMRLEHSIASKVFCTQAAHEVATLAVQLHGGNGLTREYPVEMFLRDATALTVADGENAYLSQIGAGILVERQA